MWPLIILPKGFVPSIRKSNLMFFTSFTKSLYVLSIFLHCNPSVGCFNIGSCLRSSLCHHINLAFSLFLNRHFKWYYRRVPHHLGKNSLPGTLPLGIPMVTFPNLVTQCTAYGACIQIPILIIEDAVIGI